MSEIENQINNLNKSIEQYNNDITTLQSNLRQIPEKDRKQHPDVKRIIRLRKQVKTLTGQLNTLQQMQKEIDNQRRITDIINRRTPKTARKMGIDVNSPEKSDEELLKELEEEAEAEAKAKADRDREERARQLFEQESRRQTLQEENLENRKNIYEGKNPGKQWDPLVTDDNQDEEKQDENVILQDPSPIPPPTTIQPPTIIQPPIPPPKPPKKQNKTRKIKPTPEIELQQIGPDVSTPPQDGTIYDGDNLVPEEEYLNPPNPQIRPVPINAGFTETLVQRRFANVGPMIPDMTLCPKILDTGKKINSKYFFPSQFPNLTKHKPLVIDMDPQVSKGGRKSRKIIKIKNRKGRKSCKRNQRKKV
jgi:hypothetical protein